MAAGIRCANTTTAIACGADIVEAAAANGQIPMLS